MYITIYQIIKIFHFLYFRVRPEHVEQGIKLECTAAIGAVFWQSFQEKIPVIPRIEKSTSSSNWWRSSSGASSSSSFVQHVANLILGKRKIILKDLKLLNISSVVHFNLKQTLTWFFFSSAVGSLNSSSHRYICVPHKHIYWRIDMSCTNIKLKTWMC